MQESRYAIIALFLLFVFASNAAVHAQTPCSISEVRFYPQITYANQRTSVISRVRFICGPSYDNVWKVRIDLFNSANDISSSNSTQYVYASYANTVVNVTNTFIAPQIGGVLTLEVHAYIMGQYNGAVVASWSSTLSVQVKSVAVTQTTTTSPSLTSTTAKLSTTVSETATSTNAGFTVEQIYLTLTVVFSILFIIVVAVRLKQRIRKKTQSNDHIPRPDTS